MANLKSGFLTKAVRFALRCVNSLHNTLRSDFVANFQVPLTLDRLNSRYTCQCGAQWRYTAMVDEAKSVHAALHDLLGRYASGEGVTEGRGIL